jgi:hypothetical protein
MVDFSILTRQAATEDLARVCIDAANKIARHAAYASLRDEITLCRIVENLREIAKEKRPRVFPQRVPAPEDVKDIA